MKYRYYYNLLVPKNDSGYNDRLKIIVDAGKIKEFNSYTETVYTDTISFCLGEKHRLSMCCGFAFIYIDIPDVECCSDPVLLYLIAKKCYLERKSSADRDLNGNLKNPAYWQKKWNDLRYNIPTREYAIQWLEEKGYPSKPIKIYSKRSEGLFTKFFIGGGK